MTLPEARKWIGECIRAHPERDLYQCKLKLIAFSLADLNRSLSNGERYDTSKFDWSIPDRSVGLSITIDDIRKKIPDLKEENPELADKAEQLVNMLTFQQRLRINESAIIYGRVTNET